MQRLEKIMNFVYMQRLEKILNFVLRTATGRQELDHAWDVREELTGLPLGSCTRSIYLTSCMKSAAT